MKVGNMEVECDLKVKLSQREEGTRTEHSKFYTQDFSSCCNDCPEKFITMNAKGDV